jgi:hypothetical protein
MGRNRSICLRLFVFAKMARQDFGLGSTAMKRIVLMAFLFVSGLQASGRSPHNPNLGTSKSIEILGPLHSGLSPLPLLL